MIKLAIETLKNGEKRLIGREKNFIASVLLGIVILEDEEYILFEKRSRSISQGGEISLPGGKFDNKDITTKNTAIRESCEELGILREKITVFGKYGTLVNSSGIVIDVYLGKIDIQNLKEIDYNINEVEKVILVPIKFFLNNSPRKERVAIVNKPLFSAENFGLPERYFKEWSGRDRIVYFYEYKGEVIWGITADIIYDFINNLKIEDRCNKGENYDIE